MLRPEVRHIFRTELANGFRYNVSFFRYKKFFAICFDFREHLIGQTHSYRPSFMS